MQVFCCMSDLHSSRFLPCEVLLLYKLVCICHFDASCIESFARPIPNRPGGTDSIAGRSHRFTGPCSCLSTQGNCFHSHSELVISHWNISSLYVSRHFQQPRANIFSVYIYIYICMYIVSWNFAKTIEPSTETALKLSDEGAWKLSQPVSNPLIRYLGFRDSLAY